MRQQAETGRVRGRIRRFAIRAGSALLGLVALGLVSILTISEWKLRRSHAVEMPRFEAAGLVPAPEPEGRRLAILVGCLHGCHGRDGEGGTVGEGSLLRAKAPPLGSVLPAYSDAEAARLVRFGVKRDGRSAVGMPSATFFPLSDLDLARILVELRRLPSAPPVPRDVRVGPLGRLALALDEWRISADDVDPGAPRWGELPRRDAFERGRYLASITCSECHGRDFTGIEYVGSPTLAVARAYDPVAFERLLREGIHLSGRTEGLMSEVAREAFVELTAQEIADLRAFFERRFGESTESDRGGTS